MELSHYFPVWDQLAPAEQQALEQAASLRTVPQGTLLHNGSADCLGLLVIRSGQLRAYINSEEGREVTLYRLFDRDFCLFSASCMMNSIQFDITISAEKETTFWLIPTDFYKALMERNAAVANFCLFSASCMMNSIQFDITISAEKETTFWLIPTDFYKALMERNAAVANYTNEVMATRFTDVMWLVSQIMWTSFDKRLAHFLLEESGLEGTETLKITHEKIAAHLGTAREVVTRMLKYFQTEGMVAHFLLEESGLEGTETLKITHEKIAAHLGTAREVVTRMLKYFQTEGMVRLTRGAIELLDRTALEALDEG